MLQLVYMSVISHRFRAGGTEAILAGAQRKNRERDVTGLLLFDGRRFMQVLEGEAAAVEDTFADIKRDDRHQDIVTLWTRRIWHRNFSQWAMAYRDARTADDLAEVTRELLREADPATARLFQTFTDIRRVA